MKIFTEFIVLSENLPMPSEDEFCPSLWQMPNFDSDGDFYGNYPDKRWSYLFINAYDENKRITSGLNVWVYRDDSGTMCGFKEAHDLKRFIDYKQVGRYEHKKHIASLPSVMITSLRFSTHQVDLYKEFLITVHFYLTYTKGVLVNYYGNNAGEFYEDFIH